MWRAAFPAMIAVAARAAPWFKPHNWLKPHNRIQCAVPSAACGAIRMNGTISAICSHLSSQWSLTVMNCPNVSKAFNLLSPLQCPYYLTQYGLVLKTKNRQRQLSHIVRLSLQCHPRATWGTKFTFDRLVIVNENAWIAVQLIALMWTRPFCSVNGH